MSNDNRDSYVVLKAANDRGKDSAESADKNPAESAGKNPAREPILNLPAGVLTLTIILFLVQTARSFLTPMADITATLYLGVIPARYTGNMPIDVWTFIAPVSYTFLHGGWVHLLVNTGMLWAFGSPIEREAGIKYFLLLYVLCGIFAAFAQCFATPFSVMPMIGASGSVSGFFGALLVWMQGRMAQQQGRKSNIKMLLPFVIFWVLSSVFFGVFGVPGAEGDIAWAAHIGGFLAGMFFWMLLVEKKREKHKM